MNHSLKEDQGSQWLKCCDKNRKDKEATSNSCEINMG